MPVVMVRKTAPAPPVFDYLWYPSLQNERDTYDGWGWSRNAGDEPSLAADPDFYVQYDEAGESAGGKCWPHNDTEADDILENLVMYLRTSQAGYLSAAAAWADFYTNRRTPAEADTETTEAVHCHRYGWGLVDYYKYTGTSAYLTAAEAILSDIDTHYYRTHGTGGAWPTTAQVDAWNPWMYGHRQHGRHLLLATRLAATGSATGILLRNNLLTTLLETTHWDAARGIYWVTDGSGLYTGWGLNYAAGDRATDSFGCAHLWEAFYQIYLQTGNTIVRDRLIQMAEFYYHHGIDPTYDYGASYLGELADGSHWYNTSGTNGWNTITHVNLLIYGYKLTGLTKYLLEAKHAFNRGMKAVYGSTTERTAADDAVDSFINTRWGGYVPGNPPLTGKHWRTYEINKGQLQYTRYIFENGGAPTVLIANPYTLGWNEVVGTSITQGGVAPDPPCQLQAPYTGYSGSLNGLFAWSGAAYDSLEDRMLFWGGGHGDYCGNEVYSYDVATETMSRFWGPTPNAAMVVDAGMQTFTNGHPLSRHTGSDLEFLPITNKLLGKGFALSPASAGTRYTWTLPLGGGDWILSNIGSSPLIPFYGHAYAYDENREIVWAQTQTNAAPLLTFDPATEEYTTQINSVPINFGGYTSGVFNPHWDRYIVMGDVTLGRFAVCDPTTTPPTWSQPTCTGATEILNTKSPGLAYDPVSHNIIAWAQGDSIYTLDSSYNWTRTDMFATYGTHGPTTPPSGGATGVHGRFRYSNLIDAFIAMSIPSHNVFVVRTR